MPSQRPPYDRNRLSQLAGFVLGRDRFARISAVEGIALTANMREALVVFDSQGLDAQQRRDAIIKRFTPAR